MRPAAEVLRRHPENPAEHAARSSPTLRRVTARALTLPIALLAALVLAACSGEVSVGTSKQVSADKVEEDIRGAYEAKTDIDLPRLTCEPAEAKVGARIDCDGRNARDLTLTIGGEVTKAEGDTINYKWEITKAVAPGTLFANEVGRLLTSEYGPVVADVQCPEEVEIRKGAEFSCEATARNGDTGTAVLVLTDGDGKFTLKSFDGAKAESGAAGGA